MSTPIRLSTALLGLAVLGLSQISTAGTAAAQAATPTPFTKGFSCSSEVNGGPTTECYVSKAVDGTHNIDVKTISGACTLDDPSNQIFEAYVTTKVNGQAGLVFLTPMTYSTVNVAGHALIASFTLSSETYVSPGKPLQFEIYTLNPDNILCNFYVSGLES